MTIPDSLRSEYESFINSEPMVTIIAHRETGTFHLLSNVMISQDLLLHEVTQIYEFRYQDEDGNPQKIRFKLLIERWADSILGRESDYHWNILRVTPLDGQSSAI